MKFNQPEAELFIPDHRPEEEAFSGITHMAISAHQDDIEMMAFHGILQCIDSKMPGFAAITCTDGSGSPRTGPYSDFNDHQMLLKRKSEQRQAAVIGHYAALVQLAYTSSSIKASGRQKLVADLKQIISAARPRVIYTHNPADKHDTHIASFVATIEALRALPADMRPEKLLGCEGWRSLDWLNDTEKVVCDVSGRDNLAAALIGVFDSQIAGGKRYDLATLGRRHANATFFKSHNIDECEAAAFFMDLTPLIKNDALSIENFVCAYIDEFREDVQARIQKIKSN